MSQIGSMIKKIKRIKNLGVFSDYTWDTNLEKFKRYNVIYGWNGCGKTTLSNLFALLDKGSSEKYPDLEYEIENETSSIKQNTSFIEKIRVFNQDYILNNVQVLNGKAKPIYILGEENKKIVDQIETDENEMIEKKDEAKKQNDFIENQEKDISKKFTDIARAISSNTSGEATRRYDKRDAENEFSKLTFKVLLNATAIKKHNLTLRQLEKTSVNEITIPILTFRNDQRELQEVLKVLDNDLKNLCAKTVESIVIEKLKDNPDVSRWVEDGIILHANHKSKTCEFCDQLIPKNRIANLTKHFNKADKKLKDEIDIVLEELRNIYSVIDRIRPVDKANLYEEIQDEYQAKVDIFEKEKIQVLKQITKFGEVIKDKKSKTTEYVPFDLKIDASNLMKSLIDINEEISNHNKKTSNFKNEKEISQRELEKHYLSTIYDEINKSKLEIQKAKKSLDLVIENIGELDKRITENKSKISSSHKACKTINESLNTFLGREEIRFEVVDDGYVIKRGEQIAENLSEGEKTAIAFVYFTVQLQDQDFNINEGIVVVDDPISSLDSNSLFQAFAFLKNSVKEAKQIFIFTHNFDFLRLLINWVGKIPKSTGEKGYFMIQNQDTSNGRIALIEELDKDLREHESEYHFLFKLLYNFKTDGTVASVYHIPNIARKALETFLMFRVPSNQSTYDKLESLRSKFDKNKLTAIYKFTNDQSHITGKGLNPSLVPETQKNVKYLLELIEQTFPEHYTILVDSITSAQV